MRNEIFDEIESCFLMTDEAQMQKLADDIVRAPHIMLHGKGRVGLMIKTFAIQLSRLGLYARFIGEITVPPIKERDLLVMGNMTGFPSSSTAFYEIARKNKARSIGITANPDGPVKDVADNLITLYGRKMNDSPGNVGSLQPMSTTVEHALLLMLDYVVLLVKQKTGKHEKTETMQGDAMRTQMLSELRQNYLATGIKQLDALIGAIENARRVFFYARGREMLMLSAFAMRVHHMGYTAYVMGETSVVPIQKGDLLVVSSQKGEDKLLAAQMDEVLQAGADIAGLSARPEQGFEKGVHERSQNKRESCGL